MKKQEDMEQFESLSEEKGVAYTATSANSEKKVNVSNSASTNPHFIAMIAFAALAAALVISFCCGLI